ncbi:hypothetical protein HK099_007202 [Clydaea vesicula]|uniref:Lem3/Cdc50 n=1 Tax=Clydaea vesicula TaxID=447962 RepID=A0AAD5XXZ1_9FUNG|nr:hypothetical protein HK099_007202 [Clydaea vesicula]
MVQSKTANKKPANTAFKQQRLKAWQPILTPKTVLPTFFAIGAIFVPLGIGLFMASEKVNQVIFDYTACKDITNSFDTNRIQNPPPFPITDWRFDTVSDVCTLRFDLPTDFKAPVFMYYRLTNFYQNHRRYVKSFDSAQLAGAVVPVDKLSVACDPLRQPTPNKKIGKSNVIIANGAQYYPCGLIANSLFTDRIQNPVLVSQNVADPLSSTYEFSNQGIAWPADLQKFGPTKWNDTEYKDQIPTMLIPPDQWVEAFPEWENGYNSTNLPNLQKWEAFQVWMRTAGLPNFRKLWGKNEVKDMVQGTYEISITYKFDVQKFGGTKSVVISTISFLGGKNPFLGIAYMTVGALCIILGIVFLIRHMIKPRKLGDHTYLSWNQPQADRGSLQGGQDGNVVRS